MQQIADISVFEGLQANAHAAMGYSGLGVFNTHVDNLADFTKDEERKNPLAPNSMTDEQKKQKGGADCTEMTDEHNYAKAKNIGDAALIGELIERNQEAWEEYSDDFVHTFELFCQNVVTMEKLERMNAYLSKSTRVAFNELYFTGDKAKYNPNTKEEKMEGQRILGIVRKFHPEIDSM